MTDTEVTNDESKAASAGDESAHDAEQSARLAQIDRAVGLHLAGQRYAIPIEQVQEIQQIVALSEVPGGGRGVVGMVNLRGTVIPAVDLRLVLGLPGEEYSLETPMIICRIGDQLVAVIVDEVEDVISFPPDCLQQPPAMHALAGKMLGVARLDEGLVYVLDLESMLGDALASGGGW